jgi:hypothetical protein
MSRTQQGIIGIVALMFVLIVTLFAMSQAASISASNVTDSTRQADAVEALFLAESAIEYAGAVYVSQATPVCDNNIAHTGYGASATLGRGTWTIVNTYTSGFGGSGTLPTSPYQMCRIRVQGKIAATGVTRTVDTIVSKNDDVISIASLNPNFNTPLWGCNTSPATCTPATETRLDEGSHGPDQWSLSLGGSGIGWVYAGGWDKQGGPDGSRSAFTRKTDPGTGSATTGGAFTTASPIAITVPKTLRLTFDFRVWTAGGSNQEMTFSPVLVFTDGGVTTYYSPLTSVAAGGDCATTSSAGWCESGCTITSCGSNKPKANASGGTPIGCGFVDTAGFESGSGMATNASCAPYVPPSGASGYKTGYLTYSIPGTGTAHLTGIGFTCPTCTTTARWSSKSGQVTWIWIDNLRLSVPGVNGGGPSKLWREVPETAS